MQIMGDEVKLLRGFDSDFNNSFHAAMNSPGFASVAYDMRNHGDSFHHAAMSLDDLADDLQHFLVEYAKTSTAAHHASLLPRRSTPLHVQEDEEWTTCHYIDRDKVTDASMLCPPQDGLGPVPLVLVGHSMGGVVAMHWLWREHTLHQIRQLVDSPLHAAKPPLCAAFSNPLYRVVGVVIVDVGPTQRPLTFSSTTEMIRLLPTIPVARLRDMQEVEAWLLSTHGSSIRHPAAIWQMRYYLSNLCFPGRCRQRGAHPSGGGEAAAGACWKIGLEEILTNLSNIVWCDGGPRVSAALEAARSGGGRGTGCHGVTLGGGEKVVASCFNAIPLLFIFGGRSPYNHPKAHTSIPQYFDAAKVVEVVGGDHFLHIKKRKTFASLVALFVMSSCV